MSSDRLPFRSMIPGAILFLLSFAWFLSHAVPGSYFGDCGEVLAALFTGGVPHPTCYPAYLVLATPFVRSGGTPFWVHASSAFAAAGAVLLTASLVRRITGSSGVAGIAAILLLSSSTFLVHGSTARPYVLNLVLILAFLNVGWNGPLTRGKALAAGLVAGAGFASHPTFLVGPLFLFILHRMRLRQAAGEIPWAAAGMVLSLSLFLWIPLRSALGPEVDWGHPDRWGRFVDYLTLREYRPRMMSLDLAGMFRYLEQVQELIRRDQPFLNLPLFAAAWVLLLLRRNPVAVPAAVVGFFLVVLMGLYGWEQNLSVAYRHFLPFYALSAIVTALGLREALERWFPSPRGRIGAIASLGLLLLAAGAVHLGPWRHLDRSLGSHDFGAATMKAMDRGTFLQLDGWADNQINPLAYGRHVFGWRPDLKYLDWDGKLFQDVLRETRNASTRSALASAWFRRAGGTFFCTEVGVTDPALEIRQEGFVFRAATPERMRTFPPPPSLDSLYRHRTPRPIPPDPESADTYAHVWIAMAREALTRGSREEAIRCASEACVDGAESASALVNAGIVYFVLQEDVAAEKAYRKAVALQPRNVDARLNLGILYGRSGRYVDALTELGVVLAVQPDHQTALKYYSQVQRIMSGQ